MRNNKINLGVGTGGARGHVLLTPAGECDIKGNSTQLLALVHLPSRCYAPDAYPECRRQNTTAISRTIGAHAPAVIPGYLCHPSSP